MNAHEAFELATANRIPVDISHLLDDVFRVIREAAARGDMAVANPIYVNPAEAEVSPRDVDAVYSHLRTLGYFVSVNGRFSNLVMVAWGNAKLNRSADALLDLMFVATAEMKASSE